MYIHVFELYDHNVRLVLQSVERRLDNTSLAKLSIEQGLLRQIESLLVLPNHKIQPIG